jgi:hypothetical protein
MFTLSIKPKYIELENLMDHLIEEPLVILSANLAKSLGIQARELRERGLLHISQDRKNGDTVAFLKCSNYFTPLIVKKKKYRNHTIDYEFKITNIPKIELPEI